MKAPIEYEFVLDEHEVSICDFYTPNGSSVRVQISPDRRGVKFAKQLASLLENIPEDLFPFEPEEAS
jgi:hypothetical protein